MAKKRRKTRGPRKNPKRVAAGRKAARARWGKKTSKKRSKKQKQSFSRLEHAIESYLLKHHTLGKKLRGGKKRKSRKSRKSGGYLHSAKNLANLARGRKIRKAKLAHGDTGVKHGGFMGVSLNPMFMSTKKVVSSSGTHAKRMSALAKARAVRAANIVARKAGISWRQSAPDYSI